MSIEPDFPEIVLRPKKLYRVTRLYTSGYRVFHFQNQTRAGHSAKSALHGYGPWNGDLLGVWIDHSLPVLFPADEGDLNKRFFIGGKS